MQIAFLTCSDLLPGRVGRRVDAFEHDLQVAALREGLAAAGAGIVEVDWRAPIETFVACDVALIGTAWNYQDHVEQFLARLHELTELGVPVRNSLEVVRWNIDKIYLRDLAAKGMPGIPTIWRDDPGARDVEEAFAAFGCDRVVVKRRIGAGAVGQFAFARDIPPPPDWRLGRPGLIQPFLPSIQREGEFSMIFIGGAFSHALVKRPAAGDYRIQSSYGGVESALSPTSADLREACLVYYAMPFDDLLYARIDMVRGPDGRLCLMEAELIEPYLFPAHGPGMGRRLAQAILRSLS